MKRILVTGASGFVGRALTVRLVRDGYTVRAAARQRDERFGAEIEKVTAPDLATLKDWTPLVAGCDAVVHLAAAVHARRRLSDDVYDRVNRLVTERLATNALEAGVGHFVFVSSIGAQIGPTSEHVVTENDQPRPSTGYGRSKLAAEAAVRASGINYTVLRPVAIYGPGAKGNVSRLARLAATPLPLPLSLATNKRSLLGIDNFLAAAMFALDNTAASNETFVVADPEALSLAEIVTVLRRAAGRAPALFPVNRHILGVPLGLVGQKRLLDPLFGPLVIDPEKLIAAGWRPVETTAAGLTAMVQAAAHEK